MTLKVLLTLIVVVGLYAGWKAVSVDATFDALRDTPQGAAEGPADARLTIIEFMDYRCHPCQAIHTVMDEVHSRHPEVRIVFRHMPIYKDQSVKEARIALAAGMQGRFMEMHNLLFDHAAPVEDSELPALCGQAGVDCVRLRKDMKDKEIAFALLRSIESADKLGIKAAPSFIVGRTIYNTSQGMPTADDFDRIIAAQSAASAAPVTAAP